MVGHNLTSAHLKYGYPRPCIPIQHCRGDQRSQLNVTPPNPPPLPLPHPPPPRLLFLLFSKERNPGNSVSLGRFINAFERESMQIAALDKSILRDCTGILNSIFVVRTCNTNNRQDLYILLSKTLSFIDSFNHTLKQTTMT